MTPKVRAALLLLAVFLLGGICGVAATATWLHSRGPGARAMRGGPAEQMAIRRISRRLDLDAEQRRILERVAAQTRGRMDDLREEALLRIDEIMGQAFDELLPTLREDQRAKLMQMREETRRRFHHQRRRNHEESSRRRDPQPRLR